MREPAWNINLNTLGHDAMASLHYHDNGNVGSKKYIGLAYFWDNDTNYKYDLRDLSIVKRRKLHDKLLNAGIKAKYAGKCKMDNGDWNKHYYFESKDAEPVYKEFFGE